MEIKSVKLPTRQRESKIIFVSTPMSKESELTLKELKKEKQEK